MKKTLVTLSLFLSMVFQCLAQDTISGVVSRINAPYFEQNVCDSRFALISEGETYYIMVDNYWPNPYLEDLVIHYDTIPMGNEIEVVGTIMEMEDGYGSPFKTIDVNKNLNSQHQIIFGFFGYSEISFPDPDPISIARFLHYNGFDCYFISINGELITESPLVINGRTLVEDKRYLFIGDNSTWIDYNGNAFNVFELIDALPYDTADVIVSGLLTTENDLCLSWPRQEEPYLSVFDEEGHHYLTNNGTLQNNYTDYYFRNAFGNGTIIVAGGFEAIRYDLFGLPFNALEAIVMQTEEERNLVGQLRMKAIPYTNMGPQIPGVMPEFYSNWTHYYIDNPLVWDPQNQTYLDNAFMVGDDIIYVREQNVNATFIPRMIVNNYRNPIFFVNITELSDVTTGVQFFRTSKVEAFPNPTTNVIYLSCTDQNIKHIDVIDSKDSILYSEPCNDNNIQLNTLEIHGLLFLRIELSDGNIVVKKIIVK